MNGATNLNPLLIPQKVLQKQQPLHQLQLLQQQQPSQQRLPPVLGAAGGVNTPNIAPDSSESSATVTSTSTTPTTSTNTSATTSTTPITSSSSSPQTNTISSTSTNIITNVPVAAGESSSVVAAIDSNNGGNTDNNAHHYTNGSLTDSVASNEVVHWTPNAEHLSKTNLYIRGLPPNTNDNDLYIMCKRYGHISSTKAILDKTNGSCRGYGFVEFTSPHSANSAVQGLTKSGVQAQMAKISPVYTSSSLHQPRDHHHHHQHHNHQHHGSSNHNNHGSHHHNQNSSSGNNNADPTNLYIANLPPNMSEQELENLLSNYGPVVSTRILRDQSNNPRGVGFARMESRDKCEQIIEQLNGIPCKGGREPLLVKFADSGNKKRQHHGNHHQNNISHGSNRSSMNTTNNSDSSGTNNNNIGATNNTNNNHDQSHKTRQDDSISSNSRWRESSSISDLGDLAIMSSMGYPRIQAGFPPSVAAGSPYPSPLGHSSNAPQWIHPGAAGQHYVIPHQMIQPGSLGPSNQAAALAHYGHIPQLTSQMQGLQIGHPGGHVGSYLPPQHQWSALWPHPIQQQTQPSPMGLATPMQPPPTSQQQQHSPQPNAVPQQQQHQAPAVDGKHQVRMPL